MSIKKIEELKYIAVVDYGMMIKGKNDKYLKLMPDRDDINISSIPYLRDNEINWMTDNEVGDNLKQLQKKDPSYELSNELFKIDRKNNDELMRILDKYKNKVPPEKIQEMMENMKNNNTLKENPEIIRVYRLLEDSNFGALGHPIKWFLENHTYYYNYLVNGWIYKTDREYTPEEVKLLILELEDQERQKFERLKKKHSLSEKVETKTKRDAIPEEVRVAVWRRDEGKCVKCGSRERLEYDHIIPVSKGGSNTVRNIELLCENCNRGKRDNIE